MSARSLAVLAALWWAAACAALPAAGDSGHGWFAADAPGVEEQEAEVLLVHLPPRGAGGLSAGTIRVVTALEAMPEALIAAGDRVLVIAAPGPSAEAVAEREVGSVRGVRTGLGDVWIYDPPGRLRVEPPLPGWGRLAGAAGLGDGAAVLLEQTGERTGVRGAELRVLSRGAWRTGPMPAGLEPEADLIGLVALPDGALGLVTRSGSGSGSAVTLWTGRVRPPEPASTLLAGDRPEEPTGSILDGGAGGSVLERAVEPPTTRPLEIEWSGTPLVAPEGAAPEPGTAIEWAMGGLVYVHGQGAARRLVAALPEAGLTLATLEEASGAVVPMGARVAQVWSVEGDGRRVWRMREISAATGETLFDGPVRQEGPISRSEFQLLSILLVGLMVGLLVYVLRPDPADGVVALPPGLALAEPGRRVLAGLIDLAFAIAVASSVRGEPMLQAMGPGAWLEGLDGAWALLTVLAVGALVGTATEWALGRSIGKALVGCGVISVRGGRSPRLRVWQAGARNLFKWLLAPGAAMLLVDASGRHRGDVVAGTSVVVRVRPDEGRSE